MKHFCKIYLKKKKKKKATTTTSKNVYKHFSHILHDLWYQIGVAARLALDYCLLVFQKKKHHDVDFIFSVYDFTNIVFGGDGGLK